MTIFEDIWDWTSGTARSAYNWWEGAKHDANQWISGALHDTYDGVKKVGAGAVRVVERVADTVEKVGDAALNTVESTANLVNFLSSPKGMLLVGGIVLIIILK